MDRYRSLGYDCVGITDHGCVTPISHLSSDSFTAIDSIEVGGSPDVIGVGAKTAPEASAPLQERVSSLAEEGSFTIAAHPTYSAAGLDDYLDCQGLMAIEVYNAYCEEAYANGVAAELWDMLLGEGMRIWGVASDDAHLNERKRYYSDAGRAWVEIWLNRLSINSVLESLKEGSFYSTQGPRFTTIRVDRAEIEISCSPVQEVRWRTRGSCGFVDRAPRSENLTTSRLPAWFRPLGYVRIELVDDHGRRAWSNPFFLQDATGRGKTEV